jgi:hypothetical protein
MARPDPRQNPIEQAFAGFNDWITPRLGPMAGTAIGGALGGPLGALVGGMGGYGIQQVAANNGGNVSFVQGSNLPSANTPNWQDNTGLPTYASVTGRSGGTGASAHDAWSDSLGSSFY